MTRIEAVATDESIDRAGITNRGAGATRVADVLTSEAGRLVVYSYTADPRPRDTVPTIVASCLDGGTLLDARADGRTVHWRVLMQTDQQLGLLHDTLVARLGDGRTFSFDHRQPVRDWDQPSVASTRLPPEQEQVLSLAVDCGYFETPRATTLQALANELDIPRSTASYRLRRAVATLVTTYVSDTPLSEDP